MTKPYFLRVENFVLYHTHEKNMEMLLLARVLKTRLDQIYLVCYSDKLHTELLLSVQSYPGLRMHFRGNFERVFKVTPVYIF